MRKYAFLLFALLTLFLTGCSSKYKESDFIGKTSVEIEEEFGKFDCIGMLMEDDGRLDEKIIAVPVKDRVYSSFRKLEDLPNHITIEMEHFFNVYKAFEYSLTQSNRNDISGY